jgi:hypothetical protein
LYQGCFLLGKIDRDLSVSAASTRRATLAAKSISLSSSELLFLASMVADHFAVATVEQLVRDRRRDRVLQIAGFNVFRYSGSEVWRDVFACAREVVGFVKTAIEKERIAEQRKPLERAVMVGSVDVRSIAGKRAADWATSHSAAPEQLIPAWVC